MNCTCYFFKRKNTCSQMRIIFGLIIYLFTYFIILSKRKYISVGIKICRHDSINNSLWPYFYHSQTSTYFVINLEQILEQKWRHREHTKNTSRQFPIGSTKATTHGKWQHLPSSDSKACRGSSSSTPPSSKRNGRSTPPSWPFTPSPPSSFAGSYFATGWLSAMNSFLSGGRVHRRWVRSISPVKPSCLRPFTITATAELNLRRPGRFIRWLRWCIFSSLLLLLRWFCWLDLCLGGWISGLGWLSFLCGWCFHTPSEHLVCGVVVFCIIGVLLTTPAAMLFICHQGSPVSLLPTGYVHVYCLSLISLFKIDNTYCIYS